MCHQLSLITIFWLFPLLPTSIQSLCYGLSLAIDKLKVLEPTYKWRQHDWLHLWILSVDTHHLYVSSILLSSAIAKNHQTLCPFNSSVVVQSLTCQCGHGTWSRTLKMDCHFLLLPAGVLPIPWPLTRSFPTLNLPLQNLIWATIRESAFGRSWK